VIVFPIGIGTDIGILILLIFKFLRLILNHNKGEGRRYSSLVDQKEEEGELSHSPNCPYQSSKSVHTATPTYREDIRHVTITQRNHLLRAQGILSSSVLLYH
jgi:hypothetical protein